METLYEGKAMKFDKVAPEWYETGPKYRVYVTITSVRKEKVSFAGIVRKAGKKWEIQVQSAHNKVATLPFEFATRRAASEALEAIWNDLFYRSASFIGQRPCLTNE